MNYIDNSHSTIVWHSVTLTWVCREKTIVYGPWHGDILSRQRIPVRMAKWVRMLQWTLSTVEALVINMRAQRSSGAPICKAVRLEGALIWAWGGLDGNCWRKESPALMHVGWTCLLQTYKCARPCTEMLLLHLTNKPWWWDWLTDYDTQVL